VQTAGKCIISAISGRESRTPKPGVYTKKYVQGAQVKNKRQSNIKKLGVAFINYNLLSVFYLYNV